jgi:hypothetical protein
MYVFLFRVIYVIYGYRLAILVWRSTSDELKVDVVSRNMTCTMVKNVESPFFLCSADEVSQIEWCCCGHVDCH